MSKLTLKNTRISELVDQNYVHAYVLYYFGIQFYEYSSLTLEQVCNQRGLGVDQVIREMESPSYLREAELPLDNRISEALTLSVY
jgi:regulator of cell morphogenesis and NO signaling